MRSPQWTGQLQLDPSGRQAAQRVLVWLVLIGMTGCPSVTPTPAPVPVTTTSPGATSPSPVHFELSLAIQAAEVIYRNGAESGHNAILESLGGGAGLGDFDRDGQLDLCFPGGGQIGDHQTSGWPSRLLRQRSVDVFADVTVSSGLKWHGHFSHGCSVADFNSDGFPDLLISGYGGLTLWTNLGDGTFGDETQLAGLDDTRWSSSAAWGDLNGDGVLDLYVAHYVNWSFDNNPPCVGPAGKTDVCPPRQFDGLDDVIYFGQGDGTFVDATATAGLVPAGKGLGVVIADLDQDNDMDVYVANDTVANFYYINDGHGKLEERGMLAGLALDDMASPNGSMGLALIDYDEDTQPDIWVTNYEDELFGLYHNLGTGSFQHVSRKAGLNRLGKLFVGFGCVSADLDGDGDEDVAVSNGHVVHHPRNAPVKQARLIVWNVGQGQFERDIPTHPDEAFEQPAIGRGLATGDVDRDGRLDLVFVNTNDRANLFYTRAREATAAPVRSLHLRLVGSQSPREALGARAVLETAQGKYLRQLAGGGSYLSTSETALHWNWHADVQPQRVTINWPSGRQTILPLDSMAEAVGGTHLRWTLLEPKDENSPPRLYAEAPLKFSRNSSQ